VDLGLLAIVVGRLLAFINSDSRMSTKSDQHAVKVTGPGLSFERPVSGDVANRIMTLVMTGGEPPPPVMSPSGSNNDLAGRQTAGNLTPKQFIAQRKPSTDYQRVACLAYYLTHHRNLPQFKTADISKLATEAAMHLSNPTVAVMHATNTYGFLVKAGAAKKQIATLGEEVVKALPDQEMVKAAIAEQAPRRRRKRRGRRK
jgi:hypothetical protein